MSSYEAGQKAGILAATVVAGALLLSVLWAISGWFTMIALGILYSELDILKPLGFWSSLAVTFAVWVMGTTMFSTQTIARNKN